LNRKWFDRPYPLRVRYETRYDRTKGRVTLRPVRALDVDLQRGHVAVFGTERVELSPEVVPEALQPADPRSVPAYFGGGSLAGAACCFTSARADWTLELLAVRHAAADVLKAQVRNLSIATVVTATGHTLNRLQVNLTVGPKRFLRVKLPVGAEVWSLTVNRDSCEPYRETGGTASPALLVSLQPALAGNRLVEVELLYTAPPPPGWEETNWILEGPRVDLPLKDIRWTVFAPPERRYRHFEGTLAPVSPSGAENQVAVYDLTVYNGHLRTQTAADIRRAKELQAQGTSLARQGRQFEAKQVLKSAYNYSVVDRALNEDTRVQLRKLTQQQALMGIVSQRKAFRSNQQAMQATPSLPQAVNAPLAFNQADMQAVQSALRKEDSENLEQITERMIGIQEAAAGRAVQLLAALPEYGRVFRFQRALQVRPDAPVTVRFQASPRTLPRIGAAGRAATLFFIVCLAFSWLARRTFPHATRPRELTETVADAL